MLLDDTSAPKLRPIPGYRCDMRIRKRSIAPDRIALVASIYGGEQGKIQIGGTLS
jgi:hypothetical protein